jgi:hypothetical protein
MRGVWKRSDGTAIEALPDERGVHGYIPRHISTLPESDIPGRVANSDNAAIVAVPVILVSF